MWLLALVIIGGIAAAGAVLTVKESQRPGPSMPGSTPADDSKRNKKKLTGENEKLIGLDDPSFRYQTDQGANTGMTTVKFDTTTYGDRAVLQLRNETGSTRTMGDAAILGKPVIQMSGRSGYLWEYSDYDNIDKNGEKFVEVSNRFIISPSQCEDIGDYCWKKLAPHKMYNVTIPGCHPEYEPGDVWTLSGTYIINGVTVENINAEVEIQSVSVHRACLTPGETVLTCVLYDGAWSKTNSTRSRIVGAGKPQWMQSRTNAVVIAAETYAKSDADYYCGTALDASATINSVIDVLNQNGGGEIYLTDGIFKIYDPIVMKSNVKLSGSGYGTELRLIDSSCQYTIYGDGIDNCIVENLYINGNNINRTAVQPSGINITIADYGKCHIENCLIANIYSSTTSVFGVSLGGITDAFGIVSNSSVLNIISDVDVAYGIYSAERCHSNYVNTVTGSQGYGISACNLCQGNKVIGCTTAKYFASYADSGTSYACADTPNGGFNS